MSKSTKPFAGPARAVIAIAVLANLIVAALVATSLQSSHKQYKERAAVASRNTTRLVARNIADEIEKIDFGLQVIADEIARRPAMRQSDRAEASAFLRRQKERLPMLDTLRFADATGDVVIGADVALPGGVSIVDRQYFLLLKGDPKAELHISQPVLGKISKKWILVFARRVNRADGAFLGVVIAPVAIEWFERKFAQLDVGTRGTVVLRGDVSRDFDLLGRVPPAGFVGQTKVSEQFRATITANPKEGTYEAFAGADNIRRTFSYQAVGGYPLITLVGLGTDDVLADWWRDVEKQALLASAFALLTLLGGIAVVRALNARAAAFDSVRALNTELEHDNAARRQAEAQVVRLNAELEQRVRERTAELEAANRDLESFSYSASHDLRAPLRAIAGYSKILLEDECDKLSAEGQKMLGRVIHNTERMGKLIDDILDYSRAGRAALDPRTVDVDALAREVAKRLGEDYPAARISVESLPSAECDRVMLEQVFENLIGNALKYSSKRERPEVTVGTETKDGRTEYFVRDNGAGFDMAYADGLFGMFHRMHREMDFPGTGVGLAIVKRLIERNGGEVRGHGEPDKGATFAFTLGEATERRRHGS